MMNEFKKATALRSIEQVRRDMNLPEIKSGNLLCLKCETLFSSDNIRCNKLCYSCAQANIYKEGPWL